MPRLPVSGVEVALRAPDGADEVALLDAPAEPVAAGLALLARLAAPAGRANAGGAAHDWSALSVTDFEALLLAVRAARLGNHLALGFACPGCRAPVEVALSVAAFLAPVQPRRFAGAAADPDRPGWFLLEGVGFRLPSAGDQAAVAGRPDAAEALAERCLDAPGRRGPLRARAERAMAAIAPPVSRDIAGACPECGSAVTAPVHVPRLVVGEWRREAAAVPDEVDLIARAYHWPESAILALPRSRRCRYVERIRQHRAEAA